MIKLQPNIAHRFLKQLLVRIAEMIVHAALLDLAFASVERKPVRVPREDFLPVGHVGHPVRALHLIRIPQTKTHRPQRQI